MYSGAFSRKLQKKIMSQGPKKHNFSTFSQKFDKNYAFIEILKNYKRLLGGIKVAMIISFLKQVLKLF